MTSGVGEPPRQAEQKTQQRRNLWHRIMASNIGMMLPLFCPQPPPLLTLRAAPGKSCADRGHCATAQVTLTEFAASKGAPLCDILRSAFTCEASLCSCQPHAHTRSGRAKRDEDAGRCAQARLYPCQSRDHARKRVNRFSSLTSQSPDTTPRSESGPHWSRPRCGTAPLRG